jgi:hypothetical protein
LSRAFNDGDRDVTNRQSCYVVVGVLLSSGMRAQSAEEYRIKAAFLYNFAKFVDWPPEAFKGPSDPIVIGILGKNPFGDSLHEAVAGKTFKGRAFQVREVADAQQAAACQVVFVSSVFVGSSDRKRLGTVLTQLVSSPVLTVGDTDNFAAEGEIINFKIERGTIRLQINAQAARKKQLHISAKLLSLAEIVDK